MNMDHAKLDRLVDGELSEEQRRELIARISDEPEGWKRCALAFLETQAIRANLEDWAQAAGPAATPADNDLSRHLDGRQPRTVAPHRTTTVAGGDGTPAWNAWLSLAACALLAFAVGRYGAFSPESPGVDHPLSSESTNASTQVSSERGATSGPYVMTYQPDVDMFVGESAFPRAFERQFRERGFDIQRHKGLLPAVDAQGNHIIVPYEDVNFVPVYRQLR